MSDTDRELDLSGHSSVGADDRAPAVIIDDADASSDPRQRRRVDKGLLIACFVIACGLTLIVWGVAAAFTGTDGVDRPDEIENLSPVENAQQTFEQEQILVDLEFGYEAVLVIDGVELPTERIGEYGGDLSPDNAGQQIESPPTAIFDPGNAVIRFRPSDGAPIEAFEEGRHQAQVIYWQIDEGRENARSYRWSFDVV